MKLEKKEAISLILEAIEEYNQQVEQENVLPVESDLELFSEEGNLDSLGLVSLIMCIEEKIEEKIGESIILADEKAMSQKNSPFKSVETLAEYISN